MNFIPNPPVKLLRGVVAVNPVTKAVPAGGGGPLLTVMFTGEDGAAVLAESVATATIEWGPLLSVVVSSVIV